MYEQIRTSQEVNPELQIDWVISRATLFGSGMKYESCGLSPCIFLHEQEAHESKWEDGLGYDRLKLVNFVLAGHVFLEDVYPHNHTHTH